MTDNFKEFPSYSECKKFVEKLKKAEWPKFDESENIDDYISRKRNLEPDVWKRNDFLNSQIGLAPIYQGTGRSVKIFDMLANSLPVITNIDLSNYGLKNNIHYI